MGIVKPTKSSGKFVTIPHWQRIWIDEHNMINFSGLVQTLMTEVIKTHDPKYYQSIEPQLGLDPIRRKEVIDKIVKETPIIQT